MSNLMVAIDMTVVCQDQQQRSGVTMEIVNTNVVVKTEAGEILSGSTKMIEILGVTCVSDPSVLAFAIQKYRETS